MNTQPQRDRRRTREVPAWHEEQRTGWSIVCDVLGTLILMAIIGVMFGVFPVRAQGIEAWPQVARTRSDGTCTFNGRIGAGQVVEATCLTGLPWNANVVGLAETGSPAIAGWVTDVEPQFVAVAFHNVGDIPIDARDIRVRVHLAPSAPIHPCNGLVRLPRTPMELCIDRMCRTGRDPNLCAAETGAPGAGTPGAN